MRKVIGTFIIGTAIGYLLSKIEPLIMQVFKNVNKPTHEEWVEVPFLTDK